jgi:hypothetical protein
MNQGTPGYRAYLLRLWRVDDGANALWRASLQDVRTGQRLGFANLDKAFAFLQQQITTSPDTQSSDRPRVEGQEHTGREPPSNM